MAAVAAVILAGAPACHQAAKDVPGDSSDHRPWQGIGAGETVHFAGTEPFWGGEVTGDTLIYTTPEKPEGEAVAVSRFAGRGGLSFSGELGGEPLTVAIAPGVCSDGMSDRSYPFTVMLKLGSASRQGCAWTGSQPFTGAE